MPAAPTGRRRRASCAPRISVTLAALPATQTTRVL
jgi:hypothetical protein